MNNKKQLFFDKISIVFNLLCKKDLEYFTKLFLSKESKTSFKHRMIFLKSRWLNKKKPLYPRLFKKEYPHYEFSTLKVDGRNIFRDVNEFLDIDIEIFYKRIKAFIDQDIEIKSGINDKLYRYMYVYNINGMKNNHHIDYYEINYEGSRVSNKMDIVVTPPKHKIESLKIDKYYGDIKYKKGKIILQFENGDDYISAIFNTDLISNQTIYLVGIGVGIADINQKIPVAKKVVLTKDLVEDIEYLYFFLNETEIISAKENSYKFKYNDKEFEVSYFEKYIKKIKRLNGLFENLLKLEKYNSFYEQLALKEFSAINNIFQKVKNSRSYYINYRKRVIAVLIKSYSREKYSAIYMVMPISDSDDNIFEQQSSKAILLQNELKELSRKIEIEIVFIVSKNYQFSPEFKIFLSNTKDTIKIYFALKNDIENEVNSIDFLFTNKRNFVVTRFLRINTPTFTLFKDKTTIEEHEAMYRKIINRKCKSNPLFLSI